MQQAFRITSQVERERIITLIQTACNGLDKVNTEEILLAYQQTWYNGMSLDEQEEALILSARTLIEKHPHYSQVAARLVLHKLYRHVLGNDTTIETPETLYKKQFHHYLETGVTQGILDPQLLTFDIERLSGSLQAKRDQQFQLLGIQVLQDRYLIRNRAQGIIELPQWLWMRVAMGLALNETDRETHAIAFYNLMSRFDYVPSTPTLFSAGSTHPQLSSCFLNIATDEIEGIFKTYSDNAKLSKWAGGIGTDWTSIRATGSHIRGTNGLSQGVIPWLKIDNDVALAVNQGGKRKGAHCAYLETWHRDIEDFLELRKNVGDERRRTHDINTANWIPDLFMKRVMADAEWTLFSPDQVPELHELYGLAFENAYQQREAEFKAGQLEGKPVQAKQLWRKMLTMLFETGHPWLTFKDPCNLRSPQSHMGVIHHSNLCTEITLNTSTTETAVCNLGSIHLANHIHNGVLDHTHLTQTIKTAVRMLDNVIDINFYPIPEAEQANKTHRAIGLGVMGYQEMLYKLDLPFASAVHLDYVDQLFEFFSYSAIEASVELARERGPYPSFAGSKWSQGIFPLDTLTQLEQERGFPLQGNKNSTLDWSSLKKCVQQFGMRNSNIMAIAPTATISSIVGTTPCIEPYFKNLYVTSNLSGEFTMINPWLVEELDQQGLWTASLIEALKAADGNLASLPKGTISNQIIEKYPDIFDLDQQWLIRAAAIRGKWLDQAQSLNLFVKQPSGKALHELYLSAWHAGLKTTYYLRTLGASQIEKATVDQAFFGKTHQRTQPMTQSCAVDKPDCEACQ